MASIPFSDTAVKHGILQQCEFWTGLGDGAITGNATLKLVMTTRVNDAFDKLMPRLLRYLKYIGYDDSNQTGIPTKLTNIVSGTGTYTISADTNANEALEILDVAILFTATGTEYNLLAKITADSPDAPLFFSPNPSAVGIPTRVLIVGNKLFFDVVPNYNATSGIKSFLAREQKRFVAADTTATAGIPLPFQSILPVQASKDWLVVNKPSNTVLIGEAKQELADRLASLDAFIASRNRTRSRMTVGRAISSGSQTGRLGGGGWDSNK